METQEFIPVLTTAGQQKEMDCLAGLTEFDMWYLAVGDGNGLYYEPEKTQTSLKNECYRTEVEKCENDGNTRYVVARIPADVTGFIIREVGVFDKNGNLLIISKFPETPRQSHETGSLKLLSIKVNLVMINDNTYPFIITPNIDLATTEYVDGHYQKICEKGQPNGYAPLDEDNIVPKEHLPLFNLLSYIPLGFSLYQNVDNTDNAGWLISNGQQNSGTIYKGFYDKFSNKIGEAFGAGYIKSNTEDYTDYDLVINTENTTFRLPLLDGSENILGNKYIDLSSSLSNGAVYTAPANGSYVLSKRTTTGIQNTAMTNLANNVHLISHGAWTGTTCAVSMFAKKGDKVKVTYDAAGVLNYFKFIYAEGSGNLYYFVGNCIQNQEEIDVGKLTNALANKADKDLSNAAPSQSFKSLVCDINSSSAQYDNVALASNASDFTVGAEFTAPAAGKFYICTGQSVRANSWLYIVNKTANYATEQGAGIDTGLNVYIECSKGDVILYSWYGTGTGAKEARFIYDKGEINDNVL